MWRSLVRIGYTLPTKSHTLYYSALFTEAEIASFSQEYEEFYKTNQLSKDQYNETIQNCISKNQKDEAIKTFIEMQTKNMTDVNTFNVMIDYFTKIKDTPNARRYYINMLTNNKRPDETTFHCLLNETCLAKDSRELRLLYKQINEFIQPDLLIYSKLIRLAFTIGDIDAVNDFLTEMEKNGIQFNSLIYNTLIRGYLANERIDYGVSMFNSILEGKIEGIEPEIDLFNVMIEGFIQNQDLDGAEYFFNLAKNHDKIQPNKTSFSLMIKACVENNDTNSAHAFYQDMLDRNYGEDTHLESLINKTY